MKITLAKHSGFCFGVKEAIKAAEQTIVENNSNNVRIYSCGPLIHNKTVTDELEQKGVQIINGPDEAEEGSVIIVRSHGEPEEFYYKAEAKKIKIVDATCPFVKKIHKLVREAKNKGYHIVVIGDRNHPEVIGINGWCDNEASIVSSIDEAKKVKCDSRYYCFTNNYNRRIVQ